MAKGPDPMFGARLSLEMAGGVVLQDAIREAVRVAAKAGRLVHFVFNGVALCASVTTGAKARRIEEERILARWRRQLAAEDVPPQPF